FPTSEVEQVRGTAERGWSGLIQRITLVCRAPFSAYSALSTAYSHPSATETKNLAGPVSLVLERGGTTARLADRGRLALDRPVHARVAQSPSRPGADGEGTDCADLSSRFHRVLGPA